MSFDRHKLSLALLSESALSDEGKASLYMALVDFVIARLSSIGSTDAEIMSIFGDRVAKREAAVALYGGLDEDS